MADYREISQEYAKEGIKAALLVNAGAAVAVLSQAAELLDRHLADEIKVSMLFWSAGTAIATAIWLLAFASTRYVDKHDREKNPRHMEVSNWFMYGGEAAFLASLACFVAGCVSLACGFAGAGAP